MADHVKGALNRELDTDVLFEKYNIEEIRDIEKKTRHNIEQKKEDLRVMVGERYRELIEAADTITEMKTCAQNVVVTVSRMQEMCHNLRQAVNTRTLAPSHTHNKVSDKMKEDRQFYSLAAQMKLLMDMPEKIWSALDSNKYLLAARLFLLARHTHTALQLDHTHASRLQHSFPVLARQWAAISHFRATILNRSRVALRDVAASDTVTTESLCCILLLEDATPRQVFSEFLLARTSSVQQILHAEQSGSSIKAQVCEVAQTVVTTIHQVHTIFHSQADSQVPCNLLMTTLEQVTDKGSSGAIYGISDTGLANQYLPSMICDYRPVMRHHAAAIPLANLQDNSRHWVESCKNDIRTGLGRVLGFISSVRGLAAIRDGVWTLLAQDVRLATWTSVCETVVQAKVCVWDTFFRPLFVDRTKMLLQGHFDGTLQQCKQQIASVLEDVTTDDLSQDIERHLVNYIWSESPTDIPPHAAWTPVANKKLTEGGTLIMKARVYTPAIQSLCRNLDTRLKQLLEDVGHYIHNKEDDQPSPSQLFISPSAATDEENVIVAEPFEKFADKMVICEFLQKAAKTCINKLLTDLQQQLTSSSSHLEAAADEAFASSMVLDRLLVLGRLSVALCELSPNLLLCVSPDTSTSSTKTLRKSRSSSKTPESEEWMSIRTRLQEYSLKVYNMWSNYTCRCLLQQLNSVVMDTSGQALLLVSTRWDEVIIEEETEEGQSVKSTIRVPMQASWYIQSLFYNVCVEVNRVGGLALPRSCLSNLVQQLLGGVVEAHEAVVTQIKSVAAAERSLVMPQNRALQLLFDIRFSTCILGGRRDESQERRKVSDRVAALVRGLETFIDPFDLDVFTPHMNTHLARQTQRSQVLYGVLLHSDRVGGYSAPKITTSTQEQHNVLALSPSNTRIPLLPLTSQSRPTIIPPSLHHHRIRKRTISGGPLSPPVLPPVATDQNTSFFGHMSTVWFSNIRKK